MPRSRMAERLLRLRSHPVSYLHPSLTVRHVYICLFSMHVHVTGMVREREIADETILQQFSSEEGENCRSGS